MLATDIEQLWSQDFDHYQQGLLQAVAEQISIEALKGDLTNDKLEKLTFYLRIYSSFGIDKDWPEQTAVSVNTALVNLHNMTGFFEVSPTTARLHENYAVALYRLYFLAPLQPFTNENHQNDYRKLAHYLKTDFFDGYKKLLNDSGEKYSAEFNQWLVKHNANYVAEEEERNPQKPRQLYRYTYKDYLQPAHLTEDKLHMHWQYWHENALKASDNKVANTNSTAK
ncbi:hypothetical protein [Colwellia sp. 12G3]|uniref:hypothetical protein n=1 Tax=Colwellia sp. 12G3 TaxID=2058299 RepID=UPI000C34DB0B|nr:hypothetical protein [Colwellia sp. 12G3]PKI17517.1 hypothetical protein CXF71_03705 [Colwellia sp. 12G3]